MGLYRSRFMSLLLAALVGVGMVACEDQNGAADDDGEEAAEESEESVDINKEELPFYAEGPVARIDGEEIGQNDFNKMVQERVQRMPGDLPPQMADMFKQQSVDFVIDKHLVDGVLEGEDIEVTDQEVEDAYQEFKSRFGDNEEAFQQQLDRMGMTEDEVRENMEQDVELEKYLARDHDLEVTDEEIQNHFEENKDQFADQEQVEASHILIEVAEDADEQTEQEARERAQSIYAEVDGGADFAEVAKEKSEGPTAEEGGSLGSFPRGQMVESFSKVAFDELEVGDISEPVRSEFGFHIIKKTGHQEGGEAKLADVRDQIEMQLKQQKRQQAFQQFIEGLKSDAEIEKLDDNIVMNVEQPEGGQQPMMPHGQGGGQGQPVQPQQGQGNQPQQGQGNQPQQGQQLELNTEGEDLELEKPEIGGGE